MQAQFPTHRRKDVAEPGQAVRMFREQGVGEVNLAVEVEPFQRGGVNSRELEGARLDAAFPDVQAREELQPTFAPQEAPGVRGAINWIA